MISSEAAAPWDAKAKDRKTWCCGVMCLSGVVEEGRRMERVKFTIHPSDTSGCCQLWKQNYECSIPRRSTFERRKYDNGRCLICDIPVRVMNWPTSRFIGYTSGSVASGCMVASGCTLPADPPSPSSLLFSQRSMLHFKNRSMWSHQSTAIKLSRNRSIYADAIMQCGFCLACAS